MSRSQTIAHAPGAGSGGAQEVLAVWRKLLLLGAAGAALPWLVVVLLTAAQASVPHAHWLQTLGYVCWGVILLQWTLVLMVAIAGVTLWLRDGGVYRRACCDWLDSQAGAAAEKADGGALDARMTPQP